MSFTLDIQKFAEKVRLDVTLVQKKVAYDIDAEVVVRSPVKTGRFRGNNNIGLGQADLSIDNAPDPSGVQTLSRGAAVIARADGTQDIVISNNLPYAKALENGHSKRQAPAGMYGVAVAKFQAIFETAVAAVKSGKSS